MVGDNEAQRHGEGEEEAAKEEEERIPRRPLSIFFIHFLDRGRGRSWPPHSLTPPLTSTKRRQPRSTWLGVDAHGTMTSTAEVRGLGRGRSGSRGLRAWVGRLPNLFSFIEVACQIDNAV